MGHAGQNPWDLHHAVPSVDETGNRRERRSGASAREKRCGSAWLEREGDSGQCALHGGDDRTLVGVAEPRLLGDAGVADPDGELSPVAGLELDVVELELGFELVRQPGGSGVVVSDHAVANLDGLHGDSGRANTVARMVVDAGTDFHALLEAASSGWPMVQEFCFRPYSRASASRSMSRLSARPSWPRMCFASRSAMGSLWAICCASANAAARGSS